MLRSFLDRIFPLTVLYALLTYTSLQLGPYTTPLTSTILFLLLTTWYLLKLHHHLQQTLLIRRLGKQAPIVRTYTPFNVGFLVQALWYFSQQRNHELWWKLFRTVGNPKRPYTVEAVTVGQRIIFTADEENVKAILATQFGEYGKGPQFRKEWKDFLGLSEFSPFLVLLMDGVLLF